MNIKDKVIGISKLLDELDTYYDELPNLLSLYDSKICDLLHIIEIKSLSAPQRCRVIKELHNLRLKRREIKNNMELMRIYKVEQNKLLGQDHRPFLLSDIGKTEKIQNSRVYGYRGYTEEEIKELIGE